MKPSDYLGLAIKVGGGFLLALILIGLLRGGRWLFNQRRLRQRKLVYLELTPPVSVSHNPAATEQLFAVIHGQRPARSRLSRLGGQQLVVSLEIVSSRSGGIRYLVAVEESLVASLSQTITAYLPAVKVRTVSAPQPDPANGRAKLATFSQSGHYAFPLAVPTGAQEPDPLIYLTSAISQLAANEFIVVQLVMTPLHLHTADRLVKRLLGNEDVLAELQGRSPAAHHLSHSLNSCLLGVLDMVGELTGPSQLPADNFARQDIHDRQQVAKHLKPARQLSRFEQDLLSRIHTKLSQPLFAVSLRVVVSTASSANARQRLDGLVAALGAYATPAYQALEPWQPRLARRPMMQAFEHRLPARSARYRLVLSSGELAGLSHFPYDDTAQPENLVKSLSKTLAAPADMKSHNDSTDFDVILGRNHHHGSITDIGLTAAERERHVYIIGGTGNGKTTMLQYAIVQDIANGKGVAVIDPHGDLADTIVHHIPPERIDDVIYLNPDDLTYPIGVNLLELPAGLTGDDLLREKDLITESTISVLRKIFSDDDSGGHRIEYILRNAIQTALTLDGSTLFTIFRLLNDTAYRKNIVRTLEDRDLKIFWQNELGKAGEMQRVKMSAGITAKIGRFLFSASVKRVLEQQKSTIDFDDILASGKILICNFSKGLLGEDTSTLFGTTILAKLQVASLKRARLHQTERQPYYLYVDEFQNFATMSFVQMLSEARKYRLFLTMAEQSTSQQDQQRLVDIILANVGTVICFRSGSPADERYVLPLFSPYIEQGEIANLPAYNFYMRMAALQAHEPMSGVTVLLNNSGSEAVASQVIEHSRRLYARKIAIKSIRNPKPIKTAAELTLTPRLGEEVLLDSTVYND